MFLALKALIKLALSMVVTKDVLSKVAELQISSLVFKYVLEIYGLLTRRCIAGLN